jgi:uncharacterized delta-60 repeat protein
MAAVHRVAGVEALEARAMFAVGGGADIPGARFFELAVGAEVVLSGWAPAPDGKLAVCGHSRAPGGDMFVARLNADGSFDTTFGPDHRGWIFQDVMFKRDDDIATGVFVQPDGKIVVSGSSGSGTGYRAVVLRFMPDGTLDGFFGNIGDRTQSFGPERGTAVVLWSTGASGTTSIGVAEAVAPGPDGTIYLAGRAPAGKSGAFAVARLTPTGKLDTTFGEPRQLPDRPPGELGSRGWSVVDLTDEQLDYATSMQVLPDGRVLLSGPASAPAAKPAKPALSGIGLAMFDATGRLAAGFGNGASFGLPAGTSFLPGKLGGGAVAATLQGDGKLVTAGFDLTKLKLVAPDATRPQLKELVPDKISFWVSRFNPDGNPDASFGKGGSTRTVANPIGVATGVALGADGKVLVAGLTASGWRAAQSNIYGAGIVRLNGDGSVDRTFGGGGNGVVRLPFAVPSGGAPDNVRPTAERALVAPRPDGSTMVLSGGAGMVRVALLPAAPPAGPDLVVAPPTMLAFGPKATDPGVVTSIHGGIREPRARVKLTNTGTTAAVGNVRVRLLASKDSTPDAADRVLAETSMPLRLGPRKSKTAKLAFNWPDLNGRGYFYILSQVQADGLAEAETANNAAVAIRRVFYGGGFD